MNKAKTTNRRAFTLTELLIVVIVIGVLSAVTLPKFNRVIENRKVTEAEEMMSAVRTEQERRCTLDQNYTTNFDSLSDVIASANTKNYTYSLQSQGISAKSNSGDYTLKILSYEDGSYCCTGAGCKKLNKNYPDCATLSFPTSNCAGTEGAITPPGTEPTPVEPEEPECSDGAVQGSQSCNGCGTQTTQKCVGGKWVASLGECSKTAEECASECTDGAVSGSQTCNGCGTQTTQKCVGGKWVASLGECSKTQEECSTCTEGETRNGTTPCLNGCGVELQQCINGEWKGVNCNLKPGAECPVGYEQKTQCSDGKSFSIKRCNSSCKFEEIQACPELGCSDYNYKVSHKAECCPSAPSTDSTCWTCGKPTFEWASTSNRGTLVRSSNFAANSPPQACRNKTLSSCPSSVTSTNQICKNASAGANCDGHQGKYCPKTLSYSYTQGGNGNWISHLPGVSPAQVVSSCSGTCCACTSYVSNGLICQEKQATCVRNGW